MFFVLERIWEWDLWKWVPKCSKGEIRGFKRLGGELVGFGRKVFQKGNFKEIVFWEWIFETEEIVCEIGING